MSLTVHISPDDKFIDFAIDNMEEFEDNHFFVKTIKERPIYVRSSRIVKVGGLEDCLQKIRSLGAVKVVVIHFLQGWSIDLVLKLPRHIKTGWVFWGSDGYKLSGISQDVYGPKTKSLIKSLSKNKLPSSLLRLYHRYLGFEPKLISAIKKVNFSITCVEGDYLAIKNRYNPRIKWLDFHYYSINELVGDLIDKEITLPARHVWIGNSGGWTNNHLEAFDVVSRVVDGATVYCPLSYGQSPYIAQIITKGEEIFGKGFNPLEDFVPRDQYFKMFEEAGYFFMNHYRQQGIGNVLTAIWLGKKVFMSVKSTLYNQLKNQWGLEVYEIADFESEYYHKPSKDSWTKVVQKNRQILRDKLGSKSIKRQYTQLANLDDNAVNWTRKT